MRTLTFLLASLMGLAMTACTTLYSVMPVGDQPVYLEPKEWEGLWANDHEQEVRTLSVNVVDAAGGILEFCDLSDCSQTAGRAVVRQHKHADSQAGFISREFKKEDEEEIYYSWAKYRRVGNGLILYVPFYEVFERLMLKGEMPATVKKGGDPHVLLGPLSDDQLDRITVDIEHQLFDYELQFESAGFPGLYKVSPILVDGGMRCTSRPKPDEGSGESATGGTPAPHFAISEPAQTIADTKMVINDARRTIVVTNRSWKGDVNDKRAMFLDPGHGATDLGTLGGKSTYAHALNDQGQVVGASETADGHEHAFLWEEGVMSDLGALGRNYSSAEAINKSGQVVGSTFDGGLSRRKAFLWTRSGGMTDLGTLGGVDSEAHAINDKGEVVGTSKTVQGYNRAFIWHPDTGMIDLGTLGGRDSSASAINNAGQAVGWSEITWGDTKQKHAFLWDHGNMIDLSSLPEVKAAGWSDLTEAWGINDLGQIVGIGVREGNDHVFLLTPEPPVANGH